jgi:2-polyprenyl-6-hydroxyphenyl methylase/3-demethylubiquinone-9 3-methyltransferase
MTSYYSERLSGERLRRCYEIASPRVRRYLRSEIDLVLDRLEAGARVLELGCGYGRVLGELAGKARSAVGIDVSLDSLRLARRLLGHRGRCRLASMDAAALAFSGQRFDLVACVQNGISAFRIDLRTLIREAARVTRSGGRLLFSTYAEAFWDHRLEWFRLQAEAGLIGKLDERATGDGVIVCEDGFRATTASARELLSLCTDLGLAAKVFEVDGSSLFCEITI